jgi:hypothetical protein
VPDDDLRQALEDLRSLSGGMTPQTRGRRFERWLSKFFADADLEPRSPYRPSGEEIDGSFVLDGRVYLFEAKWPASSLPASSVYEFKGKVDGKLAGTIGFYISMAGFPDDTVNALARGKDLNVILIDDEDLDAALSRGLRWMLNEKLRAAAEQGLVFYPTRGTSATAAVAREPALATREHSSSARALIIVEGRLDRELLVRVSQLLLRDLGMSNQVEVEVFSAGGSTQIPAVTAALSDALHQSPIVIVDRDAIPREEIPTFRGRYVLRGHDIDLIIVDPTVAESWLQVEGNHPRQIRPAIRTLTAERLADLRQIRSFQKFEQALIERIDQPPRRPPEG